MSLSEHKKPIFYTINVSVLTISDSRDEFSDKSGQLMQNLLLQHDYNVVDYQIIKDEPKEIEHALIEGVHNPNVDVILMNGGTGIADRDVTFDVLQRMIDKPIPGFGELFRILSYAEIGSAAMLSRASAGIIRNTAVFSTPGSTAAVNLAMQKLILPELVHIIKETRKDKFYH